MGPPLTRQVRQRSPLGVWWSDVDRHPHLAWVAVVGLVVAAVLATFGMPPVDLHLPLHHLGVMDPMCGMTRGVRLVARGDLTGGMRYNPAAPLVLLGGIVVIIRQVVGSLTGRWADLSVRWTPALLTATAVAVALLWARQQANVDLLTNR